MRDTEWEMNDEQAHGGHGNEEAVDVADEGSEHTGASADYEIVEEAKGASTSTALAKPATLRDVSAVAASLMEMATEIESFRDRSFEQYSQPYYTCGNAAAALRSAIGDTLAGKGVKP